MKRILFAFLMLAAACMADSNLFGDSGERILETLTRSNVEYISPTSGDAATAIQAAYSRLKAAGNMGTLSETNQRQLVFNPGTYTMSGTVLMDTSYVNCVELVPGTVTIERSGNSMGIVLLPGVKASVFTADNRLYKGAFSRPSVAYRELDDFDINEMPTKIIPLTGFATGATELADEGAEASTVSIQFVSDDYLYGMNGTALYKYDGSSWSSAGTAPTTFRSMWAADDAGNCVASSSATPAAIYYGTADENGDLTFVAATKDGSAFTYSASNITDQWSFGRMSSGTLLLSEYSAGVAGRYLYRSTDKGHTWAVCYDPGASVIKHWHAFGQLASTGRIVAQAGDGTQAAPFVSDDDGLTWTQLYTLGIRLLQPVDWIDIGHPTKLLGADDSSEGLLLLDLYTGVATRIFTEQDRRTTERGYCWSFARNPDTGTIYVSSLDTTASGAGTSPVIYATDDLTNWSIIYRINTAQSSGAYILKWFDGKLHGQVRSASATPVVHLALTPPEIGKGYGVSLEAAVTNQYTTTDTSSFEGTDAITQVSMSGATITRVDPTTLGMTSVPHGTKAVRIYHPTMTAGTAGDSLIAKVGAARGMAVTAGDIRSGSFMIGVPSTGVATKIDAYYIKANGTYGVVTGASSCLATNGGWAQYYPMTMVVQPGQWKHMQMPPILVDAADGDILGLYIKPLVNSGTVLDILVDQIQVTATAIQPSSWQVGGTARLAGKYDVPWQTPDKATHIFTFCPFEKAECYNTMGGDWYIRSWRVSATVYAQLYYDADDSKFKLYATDGTNTDALETDARYFKKGHPITFVVQFGDDGDTNLHLHVGDGGLVSGGTIKTVDGAAEDYTAFNLANVLVRWGDKNGANGLNGTIYDLDMTGQLAASQIVSYVDGLLDD